MMTLRSPAKVNLFLRITGRRSDGFHELCSLVQTLSLFDTLSFEVSDRDFFFCTHPDLPLDFSNLVLKAVSLFREKTGWNTPLKISLEKNIPLEAGLGGGSSNAATTLYALNRLSGTNMSEQELQALGAVLGSDVPLFFSSGTALLTGRGEKVEDRPDLALKQKCSIFKPPFGLSSAKVYQKFREVGKIVPLNERNSPWEPLYMNDLEHPAFLLRPDLMMLKMELEHAGFDEVVMSGSGSAFLCLGDGAIPSFDGFRMIFMEPIQRSTSHGVWY